jgi:hypothetical protein
MTEPQPTAAQIQVLMAQVMKEGIPHEGAVMFDDLCNVLGSEIWGDIPGQNGVPDLTISSHVREVADDPNAKVRLFPIVLNHVLNVLNPNNGLGHGVGAEAGDLIRAARVMSIVMKALGVPSLTITAGEDPAKIIASITVAQK